MSKLQLVNLITHRTAHGFIGVAKAGKSAGVLSVSPEIVAGVAIVPVVIGVWQVVRRIHRAIAKD